MLECFLLLRQSGARWPALIVIPAVIAGGVASMYLMLSGIKGIITQWIAPSSHGRQNRRAAVKL